MESSPRSIPIPSSALTSRPGLPARREGIHGFRGASGGVPDRGPAFSPDLLPPRQKLQRSIKKEVPDVLRADRLGQRPEARGNQDYRSGTVEPAAVHAIAGILSRNPNNRAKALTVFLSRPQILKPSRKSGDSV